VFRLGFAAVGLQYIIESINQSTPVKLVRRRRLTQSDKLFNQKPPNPDTTPMVQ
jgi:hypothetical protein